MSTIAVIGIAIGGVLVVPFIAVAVTVLIAGIAAIHLAIVEKLEGE